MMYELMAAVGSVPATGDTFPVKTVVLIAVLAMAAAIAMTVLTKAKSSDNDSNDDTAEQNNSEDE